MIRLSEAFGCLRGKRKGAFAEMDSHPKRRSVGSKDNILATVAIYLRSAIFDLQMTWVVPISTVEALCFDRFFVT